MQDMWGGRNLWCVSRYQICSEEGKKNGEDGGMMDQTSKPLHQRLFPNRDVQMYRKEVRVYLSSVHSEKLTSACSTTHIVRHGTLLPNYAAVSYILSCP